MLSFGYYSISSCMYTIPKIVEKRLLQYIIFGICPNRNGIDRENSSGYLGILITDVEKNWVKVIK